MFQLKRTCAGTIAACAMYLCASATVTSERAVPLDGPSDTKLETPSAWTRAALASALAKDQREVPLLIATNLGQVDRVAKLVSKLGGTVELCIRQIGYIRANLLTSGAFLLLADPAVVDLAYDGDTHFTNTIALVPNMPEGKSDFRWDELRARNSRQLEEAKKSTGVQDASRGFLPADFLMSKFGFDPNEPMDVTAWLRTHPTWDGRGVTVAFLEFVADLSNPAMQTGKDLQGNAVPKTKRILSPANLEGLDRGWVGEVHFENQALSDGTECPKPGPQEKIGTWTPVMAPFKRPQFEYCVAWNGEQGTARIDTNRDGSFADEVPLYDYNERPGYAKVYADPKDKNGRYATTYLIRDKKSDRLYLRTTPDNHSSMTATAATGTGFMGTSSGGVAPGAQVAFVPGGAHWSGLVEAFWTAATDPDIDLVSASDGVSSYPNDPEPIFELFLDRISEVSRKPIVVAARNHGPAFEQAPSGEDILTVGGYQSKEEVAAFALGEQRLLADGAIVSYSSSGPAMNGGFGVDVVTPIPGVTGWNCGNIEDRPSGNFVGKNYRLPRCWGVGSGTSVAAPRAAGVVALLLSAAKQSGLKVTPQMIRTAIMVSAKPVIGESKYRQGAGLVQVNSAWEALEEIARNAPTVIHSSSGFISPLYPYWWRGPSQGNSIYVTRGVIVGQTQKFVLDLWMDNPTKFNSKFTLSLSGDKDSFTMPTSVDLSRRRQIIVGFHSTKSGNYSALLELRRIGMKYPVAQIPIFVASTLDPKDLKHDVEITRRVTAEDQQFTLFNLPRGTHHVEARLEVQGDIHPIVSYVIDDKKPQRFPWDTRTGMTQIGYSQIPNIGDATILGVDVNVPSNYPIPCCDGTYTLKLKVTGDQPVQTADSDQHVELEAPSPGEWMKETDLTVKGGDDEIRIATTCSSCKKTEDYEMYVFKSFKDQDRKGQTQHGLWTYWPVFHGTWSDVLPRDKEDTTWKFIIMRRPPCLVNQYTPKR